MKRFLLPLILAALGIVCIALPLHIGMTGACLLLLAAVLAVLKLLPDTKKGRTVRKILIMFTIAGTVLLAAAVIYVDVSGHDSFDPADPPEFVVVLGAQTYGDQPSRTLKERLDRAAEFAGHYPQSVLFVTGGQGADETQTEASVMAAYLERKGVASSRIMREELSSTTRENLINAASIAGVLGLDTKRVLIVTSDFHLCRAGYIAQSLQMEPSGLVSTTRPWILKINYDLREVFAFVKAWYQKQ